MTTQRDEILRAMKMLGEQPDVLFCGYNVRYGRAGGSLNDIAEEKLQEFPLSENLMSGACIGLSLEGYVPVLFFERMDFVLCALDAIVNHADKLGQISQGIHQPGMIIRCVVGNSEAPLFTGVTHCQNFYEAMIKLVRFPVYLITKAKQVESYYQWALESARKGKSTMIIERKDDYAKP